MDDVPLKEFMAQRFQDLEKLTEARLKSIESAVKTALDALNLRLASMNEFCDTLRDQAARLATREQLDAYKASVETELASLRESRAELRGMARREQVLVSNIISILAIALAALGLWLKSR